MNYRVPRSLINTITIIALIWSSTWQIPLAAAAASLTITPTTWDVIGLDSNKVTDGPNTYMVGARVCNTGSTAATNVVSNFIWDSANTYINLSGASSLSITALGAGACTDFYYNILITRNTAAYNSTRGYHITATADTLATISTPTPRQLFVEKLVSQNRNAVASVSGATSVVVGQTYQYVVNSSTAPGGYEQLEAFLNFPNVMFQLISVSATYTSPSGGTNNKVYANACGWDPVPTSPNYRSCIGPQQYTGGKAGGTMVTTYNVKILSAGTATLTTLIYDFSGSSYHYNSDFGVGVNLITVTATNPSPPVANNDSTTTTGTTPATLTPATNDTASSGTTLAPGTIDLDPALAGQQTTRTTAEGAWALNIATGTVTFTPVTGFVGAATIPYTIQNNVGQTSNPANLTVTVSPPPAPTATNDSTTTTGTTPATLTPAANDTAGGNGAMLVPSTIDLDPATLGQQTTRTTAQGSWVLDTTTGQVTFTPVAGYAGTASIPYTIKDNYGTTSNQATLSVTVGGPAAPTANSDSTTTTGTTPVALTPATNDTAGGNGATLVPSTIDLDPATLGQQTMLTVAGKGAWVLDTTTSQVTFTAMVGFVGTASIPYTIQDSYGQTSNQANLIVTVSLPAAPTANDDSTTTTGTTPATLVPATNDAAGSGATLVAGTIDLDPATAGQQTTRATGQGGWVLDAATGTVTFTPAAGFVGTASIPYTIMDSYGQSSNVALLSVTVSAPAAPIANNDSTTTTGTIPATLVPVTNDTAGGNGATLVPSTIDLDPATAGQQTTLTDAGKGIWALDTATGNVTFLPVAGFNGTATIPYTIKDNYGTTSNQANLSVTVGVPAPPTANDDSTTTTGTNLVTLVPAANDTAGGDATLMPGTIDLDPATAGQQTTLNVAGQGSWVLDPTTGQVTFTAVAAFTGSASIPYTIKDNYGQTSNQANLTVTVSTPPAAPTANPDSTTTTGTTPALLDPVANDQASGVGALVPSTIDLDPTTIGQQVTLSVAGEGVWTLNTATGQVTFAPVVGFVGTASIPYTIDDSNGLTSNQANLSVTVSAPAAPTATDDSTTTTGTTPATLVPATNDTTGGNGATLVPSTIDLDPATAGQQTTQTTVEGVWGLNTTSGQVTFAPAAGFSGTASIPYTIEDSYVQTSNVAILLVTVSAPPAPTANNDSTSTTGTNPATLVPATNDTAGGNGAALVPSTIDLDPATPGQQTTLTDAGKGIWALDTTTGNVTFLPVAGFNGTATIPYTIKDNYGTTSNQANLSVLVGVPAPPTANDDSTTTTGTTPATLTPASNDTTGGSGVTLLMGTIDLDPATPSQDTTRTTVEGVWVLNTTSGTVAFTPAVSFVGMATIPYTIQDSVGQTSNPANLTVTVSAPAAPTANNDGTTTTGMTPALLTPATNDTAGGNGAVLVASTIDLDPATVGQQTTLTTAQGTWILDTTSGQVSLTPVAGFTGATVIPYTIQDNYGTTSNQANLTVTAGAPAAPTANDDSTSTTGTTPALLTPATNDTAGGNGATLVPSTIDLDPATAGQQTTLSVVGEGVWTLNTTTGQVAFSPVVGLTGMASIPYTIQDNYGTTSNQANLTVTISAPTAPTANDDSTTTTGTNPVTLVPVANDAAGGNGAVLVASMIDLDPATLGQQTTLSVAGQGAWTLDTTNGTVSFTPALGFVGTAAIPYTIQDNYGTISNQANLSVLVSTPSGLTANPDSTTTIGTTPVMLIPAANDAAGGNGATLVPSTIDLDPNTPGQQTTITTAQGTWTLDATNGTVTFTPAVSFVGTATIPYTIQDNYGTTSNQANLSVVVSTPTAPTANNDSTTTTGTAPVTLTPVTNDGAGGNGAVLVASTIDLDPATPGQQTTIITTQGTWTLDTTTGQVTFIPAPGFSGTATLPYTVQNNYGQTSPPAILSVTVIGPTAITLASFTASREGDQVVVRWVTTAEFNTWGFQLYRSVDGTRSNAVLITPMLISGQGRGQGGASYIWIDANAEAGLTYIYWLQEVEFSGVTNEYGSASAMTLVSANEHVFLPFMGR